MNLLKKIAGFNLLAILVYSIIIRLLNYGPKHNDASLGILILSAFAVGLHVLICALISFFEFSSKRREKGRAWILSAGIVLLVGFSVCLGNANF